MDDKALAEFKAHAIAEYPRECCGVVVIWKGKYRYIRCHNLAQSGDQFTMSDEDFTNAADLGEIVAICHSHPNAPPQPSQADLVECENAELYEWHIINVHVNDNGQVECGAMHSFNPSGYAAPLVGRRFHHGTLDCFTLIRDYYATEHGIEIPNFAREDNWWNNGQNLYRDNFQRAGFRELTDAEDVQVGDVFLMTIRSPVENHAAVYIGDGMILHHFWGRLSSRDPYLGYWRENTTVALRHKDLTNAQ
ncbi:MAG TPA: Mov34/MPN/PAD-1 family protein [Allosphingosinicella sp.]|jgi:proteasome lid subunit RPN8/RPN11